MEEIVRDRFRQCQAVLAEAEKRLAGPLVEAARVVIESYRGGGTVYVFGNGGSAADSQHIACELVGRFLKQRKALRAFALTTDTSILTAVPNDYDFQKVFVRQIEACGRDGDVAIALSTSGNSANVVAALAAARDRGMRTIVFTGRGGGKCGPLAEVLLDVDSELSPRIQEVHAFLYHTLCELVEREFAED